MRICAVYKHTPRPESRPRALPSGPGTTGGSRERIGSMTRPHYPLFSSRLRADAVVQPASAELTILFHARSARSTVCVNTEDSKEREGSAPSTGYLGRSRT